MTWIPTPLFSARVDKTLIMCGCIKDVSDTTKRCVYNIQYMLHNTSLLTAFYSVEKYRSKRIFCRIHKLN